MEYIDHRNANPKPFTWTMSAGENLEEVARAKHSFMSIN
jgi:hypothetical protein